MTKKVILSVCSIFLLGSVFAQESNKKDKKGRFYGGFESNSQYYLDDNQLGAFEFDNRFRSNSFLTANYNYGKWTAGFQIEGYEKNALLNYNPKYKGTNFGIYYVNYKTKKIDATLGHFYEQFGSGLLLRTWEDRPLGINNALRGARIKFKPTDNVSFTALMAQQRSGFDVSDGIIFGFNTDFYLNKLFHFETSDLSFGASYVGREEKITIEKPEFQSLTNAFAGRINFNHNTFYLSTEYNYKQEDAVLIENIVTNNLVKPGSAFLLNTGFSSKGLGLNVTLRRLENMTFLSERTPAKVDLQTTSFNFNDKILNFTPAITKQHHYNLANIYVYQAQAKPDLTQDGLKAGETGGQIDFFYTFAKGTKFGGKYGTKVAMNFANWYNLPGEYRSFPAAYNTKFFGTGNRFFTDYSIEFTKKFTKTVQGNLEYTHQFYNKQFLGNGAVDEVVNTNILAGDISFKLNKTQSMRVQAEHMWADADMKNWAGATVEYNYNSKVSFYAYDLYNYGNSHPEDQTHYYNLGGSYRKGASRIALNYGRQRGGLVCVGGVCREVPQSKGVSLALSTTF